MKCWISKAHIFQRNILSKSRIPDSTWSQCPRGNEREEVVLEHRPLNENDLSAKKMWGYEEGHQLDMDRILKLVILGLKRRKVFSFQRELTSSNWWTTSDITSGTWKSEVQVETDCDTLRIDFDNNHLLRHPEDVAGGEGHVGSGAPLRVFHLSFRSILKVVIWFCQ